MVGTDASGGGAMMSINWEAELQKAKFWSDQKECRQKFIDLAKQISDELTSYKSMWKAEFELRRKAEAALKRSNSRVMNKPFRPEMEADVF